MRSLVWIVTALSGCVVFAQDMTDSERLLTDCENHATGLVAEFRAADFPRMSSREIEIARKAAIESCQWAVNVRSLERPQVVAETVGESPPAKAEPVTEERSNLSRLREPLKNEGHKRLRKR